MANRSINQLYAGHQGKVSDKWSSYLKQYERLLNDFRDESISLLEIGVQNGGSLEIWSEYFSNAQHLIGCDINPECAALEFADPRIVVVIGDADKDSTESEILSRTKILDIIIDDGSHQPDDIVPSFARYFPHLSEGGIYIVEDLHVSYWQEFGGGLFHPFSSILFFKRLVDIVNAEHWGVEKSAPELLGGFFSEYEFQIEDGVLNQISSIEFANSMCIIRKASAEDNRLGTRVVVGTDESIWPGLIDLDGLEYRPELASGLVNNQSDNKWTNRPDPPEEELMIRLDEIAKHKSRIQGLRGQLAQSRRNVESISARLNTITSSKPYRFYMRLRSIHQSLLIMRSEQISWFKKILRILSIPLTLRKHLKIMRDMRIIRRSGYFDAEWYLAKNPDVMHAGIDPARHYLLHGGFEGRDPGPDFSSHWYLMTNSDVRGASVNPLVHFLRFGQRERRFGKPGHDDSSHDRQGFSVQKPGDIEKPERDIYMAEQHAKNFYQELSAAKMERDPEYETLSPEATPGPFSAKLLAFYLPQFHPIPENDEWWGKGFTEWTNISKAVPQFVGHYQPHLPGELGFYDLRVPEVQRRQVELANHYGIFGFCFYYYWFNGKRLLERPLEQFTSDSEIDFPFCLCWANENWTRRWDGLENEILIAQDHSAETDFRFIRDIAPYLEMDNYIRIGDRPLLIVYRTDILSNPIETTKIWREYAVSQGLGNPYLVAAQVFGFRENPEKLGFDAALEFPPNTLPVTNIAHHFSPLNPGFQGQIYDYAEASELMTQNRATNYRLFKTVMPGWDNTARRNERGNIFINTRPSIYEDWLASAIDQTKDRMPPQERIVFINAWNEWAEGAHLEPDRKFGYAFLQATANALLRTKPPTNTWKILFVSHDAHMGGAQLSLLSILQWFKEHTHIDLRVLCIERGRLYPSFNAVAEVMNYADIAHLSERDQIDRILSFCDGVPDLIYANSVASGKLHSLLDQFDKPILTHVRELNSSIERYAGDWFDEILATSDAYIACSDAVRTNLIAGYGVKKASCTTAYTFIPLSGDKPLDKQQKMKARRALGLPENKKIIYGCGIGMPYRKGADLFINTARQLLTSGEKQFHFYWLGEFSPRESAPNMGVWKDVLKEVEKTDLKNYVTFLGFVENPGRYLQVGDIFLLTSREEPLGRVVLEAAEFEIPTICFDKAGGGLEFVRDDAGFIVPFEDTKAMAEKVALLMHDEYARQALGTKARQRLLNAFTMDRVMPNVLSYSRKVAGKNPRVSIIVPNYNHAHYLPQRLESIFGQTFQDFEVFLMDDASSDESVEILKRYADRDDVHLILNEENSGSPFNQWLKAFSLVQGDIIWIAESDDLSELNFLEKLLPAFDDPEVKLAYCASKVIGENGVVRGEYADMEYLRSISENRWKEPYCIPADQEVDEAFGIKNTMLNISAVLFRRTEFSNEFSKTIGDMHVGGDTFLILNVMHDGKVFYEPSPLNFHRRHKDSIVGKVLSEKGDEHLRRFFRDFNKNKEFVVKNYHLSSNFEERLSQYLVTLWSTLAPGRPYEEIGRYMAVDDLIGKFRQKSDE